MGEILFFAEFKEAAGTDKVALQTDGLTVGELKQTIQKDFQLDNLNRAMVAVNEEYAHDDASLQDGDVVAFIPPVSGG